MHETEAKVRRAKDQRRIPLSMRITPQLRERLVAQAGANGRSITQEAEFRLEQSFQEDKRIPEIMNRIYGRQLAGFLMLIGAVLHDAGRFMGFQSTFTIEGADNWMDLPYPFGQAEKALNLMIEAIRPAGDPGPPKSTILPALAGSDFDPEEMARQRGPSFAWPYLDAVADPGRAITKDTAEVGLQIRDLLGAAADRIAPNLKKLGELEETAP